MLDEGELPKALKFMVAEVVSNAAGNHPPAVTDEHFVELRKHCSEDAIAGIVAVIALLGWLNRSNQTLATPLEASALAFANKHIAPSGWMPGPPAR